MRTRCQIKITYLRQEVSLYHPSTPAEVIKDEELILLDN